MKSLGQHLETDLKIYKQLLEANNPKKQQDLVQTGPIHKIMLISIPSWNRCTTQKCSLQMKWKKKSKKNKSYPGQKYIDKHKRKLRPLKLA